MLSQHANRRIRIEVMTGGIVHASGCDLDRIIKVVLKLHSSDFSGRLYHKSGHEYEITENTVKEIARVEKELIKFQDFAPLIRWLQPKGSEEDEAYKIRFWTWVSL